tara:strand:- start:1007 stop:1225 length:219 start_codon:yes stop_codon:yes gene_type:complete
VIVKIQKDQKKNLIRGAMFSGIDCSSPNGIKTAHSNKLFKKRLKEVFSDPKNSEIKYSAGTKRIHKAATVRI